VFTNSSGTKLKHTPRESICARRIGWRYTAKTWENAIVEYLVTQLKGPKGNGDIQALKRD